MEHIEFKVIGILCVCERDAGPEHAVRAFLQLAVLPPFGFQLRVSSGSLGWPWTCFLKCTTHLAKVVSLHEQKIKLEWLNPIEVINGTSTNPYWRIGVNFYVKNFIVYLLYIVWGLLKIDLHTSISYILNMLISLLPLVPSFSQSWLSFPWYMCMWFSVSV